jgi:hypothetical protein
VETFAVARQASGLVERNSNGELVALKQATERAERFQLHCRAYEVLDELPPKDEFVAAYKVVDEAINIKPAPKQYQLLAGIMLDGLAIKAGDDTDGFIQALSWCLVDAEPDAYERSSGPTPPPWIPIPALAAAVQELWRTHRGNFGRPPAIPEIIELCTRYRQDLVRLRSDILNLGRAQHRLGEIVKATDDSYPEEDWS